MFSQPNFLKKIGFGVQSHPRWDGTGRRDGRKVKRKERKGKEGKWNPADGKVLELQMKLLQVLVVAFCKKLDHILLDAV